jgi:hypothetical protein
MEQIKYSLGTMRAVNKNVSKGFYLGSYIGATVCILILSIIMIVAYIPLLNNITPYSNTLSSAAMEALGTIGISFMILVMILVYYMVVYLRLVYKAWEAIQDGHQRTTPGRAVGYLFIPFYSFYWIFQVVWGYSKDYNAYIERYHLGVKKLPEDLFKTNCIIDVASNVLFWIPLINFLIALTVIVLKGITINQLCDGINRLSDETGQHGELGQLPAYSAAQIVHIPPAPVQAYAMPSPIQHSAVVQPVTTPYYPLRAKLQLPCNNEIELADSVKLMGRTEFDKVVPAEALRHISRNHFLIKSENGKYFVEDLNSTNGTKVNGLQVNGSKLALNDGDQIEVASVVALTFKVE